MLNIGSALSILDPMHLVVLLGRSVYAAVNNLPGYDVVEDFKILRAKREQKAKFDGIAGQLIAFLGNRPKDAVIKEGVMDVLQFLFQKSPAGGAYIKRNELSADDLKDPEHGNALLMCMLSDLQLYLNGELEAEEMKDNLVFDLFKRAQVESFFFPELSNPQARALIDEARKTE